MPLKTRPGSIAPLLPCRGFQFSFYATRRGTVNHVVVQSKGFQFSFCAARREAVNHFLSSGRDLNFGRH